MQHNHRSERPVKRRDLWGQGIPGAVLLIVWSILCGALEIGQVPYVSWCLICSQFLLLIVKRVAEQCTCFIPAMFLIGLHPSCSLGSTIPLVFFIHYFQYVLLFACSIVVVTYRSVGSAVLVFFYAYCLFSCHYSIHMTGLCFLIYLGRIFCFT